MNRFLAILDARNKEFLRDRASLAWNILFPLLIVLGFSFAFSGKPQDLYKVAVSGQAQVLPGSAADLFLKTQFVQFVPIADLQISLEKLKHHQFDMVVAFGDRSNYWINSTSPKGYMAEKLLLGTAIESASVQQEEIYAKKTVEGQETRYVDWLIAGLLGMNMMFSALFGVGYVIVRYRKNGVLRRFKATPISAFEFLSAQVVSRFLLIMFVSIVVYFGCHMLIDFQMVGSYFNLFLILGLGALCLISLGLVVASRVQSEELANGVLNLMTWPMMFFSGVWFSLEGANPVVQKIALLFPLTHVIDGARAVMLEGASLAAIAPHLVALSGMTFVFLAAGSLLFRWD